MIRRSSLALACLALASALAAGTAEAQTTAPECPPGQPCVIVVPQQQPQPQPVQAQPTPPPAGYVVVQPAQPPPGYGQPQAPVYGVQPVQQRQPVQVTQSRIRWGLVGPGIGLLAGGWVGNWLTGAVGTLSIALSSSGDTGDYFGWSWVPVIGPWVNAGYMAENDGFLGMHILWGVLQTGGLLMCILGTVLQEEVTEIRYVQADGLEIAVMPWADATGAGASLSVVGF